MLKRILKNKHIQFVFLFIAGSWLMLLSVRNVPLSELWARIQTGNFGVVLPVMMVSLLGYYFRSLRWKLILKNMQVETRASHLYAALSIGYAVNFATPRLGEITRCLTLHKSSDVPVDKSLISVFIERIADVICLAVIVLSAFWMSMGSLQLFLSEKMIRPLINAIMEKQPLLLLFFCILAGGTCYLVYQKLSRHPRVREVVVRIMKAFRDVLMMKEKVSFLIYTIIIWSCYFFMTYLWFGIFPETGSLGLKQAFVIMAVGSVGRSVPIQGGGMGAYHYLVSNVFSIFGVSLLTGNAMAFIIHGAQMILTISLGIIAWIWLLIKTEK